MRVALRGIRTRHCLQAIGKDALLHRPFNFLAKPVKGILVHMLADIIKVDPKGRWVGRAVEVLKRGGLVAFPTETVYGLGADARNVDAVLKVFKVKRRPLSDALILHVSSVDMAKSCVREFTEDAERLAKEFWPGPLTMVLPKSGWVSKAITGGSDKVGVRWPAHPVAEALISAFGSPLVAPSANISGRPSPTRAEDVAAELGNSIDLIVDGGETPIGIESTVLDLTEDPPAVLRPGAIPAEEISRVLGREVRLKFGEGSSRRPRYSPRSKLVLVTLRNEDLLTYVERVMEVARRVCGDDAVILASTETAQAYLMSGFRVIDTGSRRDALDVARKLYRALRVADAAGKGCIVTEDFKGRGLWVAIRHRLLSAASDVIQ